MILPLRYRRLDEGGVLFNPHTWSTHVLTPAAAIIYEALTERAAGETVPIAEAIEFLRSELAVDTDSGDIKKLLAMLQHLRVISG